MKSSISIPALDKAVRILDLLTREATPMSGADIAKILDLPRSSVHGLLAGLLEADLVRKTDERHFALGTHVMYWANGFLAQQDVVAEFHEAIARIPELAPYTLTLSTLSGDQVVYLACKNSNAPLGFTFRIGMQVPAVFTATGKMMLSGLSDEEVKQIISHFPPPFTDNSVQNHHDFAHELAQIRRQGYAVDNGQLRLGMHCFGVAVYDHNNQARFGVAASLIEQEADEAARRHLIGSLQQLAARLTQALGGQTR
ncbi:IclR family transcriptional regulator [Uruburuella testudinis]|uniref:IclR family transcriptional regulator n=1 Tax=Uruburuella testudinis TaxID=1282863 RepID=A0ABY4DQZ6_9NEIS|nr:IclR family transcriptional regulator [Uruburuella testudinis]UOO81460.1 IclR family transcriptional regulator [Uruburuella testudinis]